MNFKKIELVGFKSFADKLEIKFEPGITGIVGPNGCGKSNVSDAIRWVLGEQSTKLLRGNSMQDVIFNGTEKRKSMSYCEVSLFFDNSKRFFNLDFDEVSFTRKLYRSGESEYMINATPCRLKDVVSALHDSGIGKDGYSIIGQGKVEEIISAKPENRRAIFEEAAGISKFKQKKIEAEKKLERTQENLNRAQDVLTEQERQLGPLKKQAENAKIYLELKDKLKNLEVNSYISQYDNANFTKENIQTKINGFAEELNIKQASFDKTNDNYNSKMLEIANIDKTLQELNNKILEMTVSLEKNAGETNVLKERIKFLNNSKDNLTSDLERETLNKENTLKLIDENEKIREEKQQELKKVNYSLVELSDKYLKVVEELTNSEDEANQKQKEIINELSKITDTKSNISALKAQKEAFLNNITDLEGKIYNVQSKIKEKENSLSAALTNSKQAQGKYNDLIQKSKIQENEISSLSSKLTEVSNCLTQNTSNIQILQNRKKVLEDMQKDFEGYNYSVKRLMQDSEKQFELKNKIVGIVASCMTIPNGFETAIEVALGGAVQDVITKNEEDSKYLINYLKRNNLGRATFLPLSSVKIKLLNELERVVVKQSKAFGVACDLIKFEPNLKPIFQSLLGRVVIVSNIDQAVNLAKQTAFSFRIVTLDGDVISPQGSLSGGSKKAISSNLLMRDNEIESLNNQINKLNILLNNYKNEKIKLENDIVNKEELLANTKNELVLAQVESAKQNQNYEQLSLYVDELNKERIVLSQNKLDFVSRVEILEKTIKSVKIDNISTGESAQEIDVKQKIFATMRSERDSIQNQLTEFKIKKTSIESEINAVNSELERLNSYNFQLNFSISEIKNNLEKIVSEVNQSEIYIKTQIEKLNDTDTKIKLNETKTKLSSLDSTKQQIQDVLKALDEDKSKLMLEINAVQEKKYQQEMNLSKVDTDIESMQEKIFEDYELTYSSCLPFKQENFDLKAGQIEINKIKREINKLGYINVNAIEDCKDLLSRYEDLSNQANDLTVAKEDLIKIIKDLSEEMLSRFNVEFEKIQTNFSKIFRELFGGGNAKLELTESEDPLLAGVDIVAEPPGKKLQSITLLSGGEKALTAIAILFAILKLKPMPFCLLDEIEAALDDTNVSRFAQYLKNFSKDTQFIVITHRKPTMMLADSLYGVTMQEKGVSRIVSVKLSEAIKNSSEEQSHSSHDNNQNDDVVAV